MRDEDVPATSSEALTETVTQNKKGSASCRGRGVRPKRCWPRPPYCDSSVAGCHRDRDSDFGPRAGILHCGESGSGGSALSECISSRTPCGIAAGHGSGITGARDPRVFALGRWLRRLKLDELPQLLNIVRGDMAFGSGRAPRIPGSVDRYYTDADRETLETPPGLTSPGTALLLHACRAVPGQHRCRGFLCFGAIEGRTALDRACVHRASGGLRSGVWRSKPFGFWGVSRRMRI